MNSKDEILEEYKQYLQSLIDMMTTTGTEREAETVNVRFDELSSTIVGFRQLASVKAKEYLKDQKLVENKNLLEMEMANQIRIYQAKLSEMLRSRS